MYTVYYSDLCLKETMMRKDLKTLLILIPMSVGHSAQTQSVDSIASNVMGMIDKVGNFVGKAVKKTAQVSEQVSAQSADTDANGGAASSAQVVQNQAKNDCARSGHGNNRLRRGMYYVPASQSQAENNGAQSDHGSNRPRGGTYYVQAITAQAMQNQAENDSAQFGYGSSRLRGRAQHTQAVQNQGENNGARSGHGNNRPRGGTYYVQATTAQAMQSQSENGRVRSGHDNNRLRSGTHRAQAPATQATQNNVGLKSRGYSTNNTASTTFARTKVNPKRDGGRRAAAPTGQNKQFVEGSASSQMKSAAAGAVSENKSVKRGKFVVRKRVTL
jgi:hypothetical protein